MSDSTDTPKDKAMKYALAMHSNRDYEVKKLVADAKVIETYLTSTDTAPVKSASGITFDKDGKQLTGPTPVPAPATTAMPTAH